MILNIIGSSICGLFLGYMWGRYKSNCHHEEEIHNIQSHYEVKLKKKTLEDRVRNHG